LNLNDSADNSAVPASGKTGLAPNVPAASGPPVWKVLVLDQYTKDVLATVLRVQDLRDVGVTLHVYVLKRSIELTDFDIAVPSHRQLHSVRPPLADVPAVYFVSPTLANIRRISEDLEKCLYESFHFNFVEPLPRALLEELAASVAKHGTGDLVEQVRWCLSLIFPNRSS